MHRPLVLAEVLLFFVAAAYCQGAPASAQPAVSRPAPKFDVSNIDTSLDPCVDFYEYSCAKWMKNNPIPPDYPEWVSFAEVEEHNLSVLHNILEKAAPNDPKRPPVSQKIGDFYASCMDEQAANRLRFAPLKPAEFVIIQIQQITQPPQT